MCKSICSLYKTKKTGLQSSVFEPYSPQINKSLAAKLTDDRFALTYYSCARIEQIGRILLGLGSAWTGMAAEEMTCGTPSRIDAAAPR